MQLAPTPEASAAQTAALAAGVVAGAALMYALLRPRETALILAALHRASSYRPVKVAVPVAPPRTVNAAR